MYFTFIWTAIIVLDRYSRKAQTGHLLA